MKNGRNRGNVGVRLELSERQIMDLFVEKIARLGRQNTWVANVADPTEVTRTKSLVLMHYGFTVPKEEDWDKEDGPYDATPGPENVNVDITSSYIGHEVTIATDSEVYRGFYTPGLIKNTGLWNVHSEHTDAEFISVIKRILLEGE